MIEIHGLNLFLNFWMVCVEFEFGRELYSGRVELLSLTICFFYEKFEYG